MHGHPALEQDAKARIQRKIVLTCERAHFLRELPCFFIFAAQGLHHHGNPQPVGQNQILRTLFRTRESLRDTTPAVIEPPREAKAQTGAGQSDDEWVFGKEGRGRPMRVRVIVPSDVLIMFFGTSISPSD